MMRSAVRAAVAAVVLMTGETALAADGQFGPTSSASIAIRVSVAPRAWQASGDTLCVAAPGGFTIRTEPSSPLRWLPDEQAGCTAHATQLRLIDAPQDGSAMLLVVPE